eukprot:PhF_6_TR43175/c0_g2_i1/m.66147
MTFKLTQDLIIQSCRCDDCFGDKAGAFYMTQQANVIMRNITITRIRTTVFAAIALFEMSILDIDGLFVRDTDRIVSMTQLTSLMIRKACIERSVGIYLYSGSVLSLDSVVMRNFTSSDSAMFEMWSASTVTTTSSFTIENTYTPQIFYAREDSVINLSSLSVRNVVSWMDGGIFSIYDKATLRVGELSVINIVTLRGNGGVLLCNTSMGCEIRDIVTIQGAASPKGSGGIVSTPYGSGNVSLTCRAGQSGGSPVVEGSSGGVGGCFHIGDPVSSRTNRSFFFTVNGCKLTSCASCSGLTTGGIYQNVLYAPFSNVNGSVRFVDTTFPTSAFGNSVSIVVGMREAVKISPVPLGKDAVVEGTTNVSQSCASLSSFRNTSKQQAATTSSEDSAVISQAMTTAGSLLVASSDLVMT